MASDRIFEEVRSVFDQQAAFWKEQYNANGPMADRIARFQNALSAVLLPGASVLDYGCGTGDIATAFAKQGFAVTAGDISAEMIARARQGAVADNPRWVLIDPGAQPHGDLPNNFFDAVVSSSVLEYVSDPTRTLKELSRMSKPGAYLAATVPDIRHRVRKRERLERSLVSIRPIEKVLYRTRLKSRVQYLLISRNRWAPQRWAEAMAQAGWHPESIAPCSHPLLLLRARKQP